MASFLDSTIGIQLVVVFLGAILYGMGLLQCWLYFQWYPRDNWRIKYTVLLVLFFETFQLATLFARTYQHTITKFGNLASIISFTRWDLAQQQAGYASGLIVQLYFAHTLYAFDRKNIYCSLIIVALAIISYGGGLSQGVTGYSEHFPSELATKVTVTIQSAAALACDIAITASLCVVFRHCKTGLRSTDSMLQTLTVYAIGRGGLTAIAAAVSFICIFALPGTYYFIIGLLISGKLYMNSMLFSLNSRQHIRNHLERDRSMVAMDFMSSSVTQEPTQDDSAKLRSFEPCSSSMADATDSGEKSNTLFSMHLSQPTTQSSAC